MSTTIFAVASQKGGVGKTTTVLNAGTALARLGHRTLLVDLDPQNGVMFGAGLDEFANDPGIFELIGNGGDFDALRVELEVDGLDVLLAGSGGATAAFDRASRILADRPDQLAAVLSSIAGGYEYVLLDCPAGIGSIPTAALAAANMAIIPVQCHPLALRSLPTFLHAVLRTRAAYNPALSIAGILLTMYDARLEAHERVAEQVWASFPSSSVFEAVIPRHDALVHDFAGEGPVAQHQPRSPGTQAYMQLARELVALRDRPSAAPAA